MTWSIVQGKELREHRIWHAVNMTTASRGNSCKHELECLATLESPAQQNWFIRNKRPAHAFRIEPTRNDRPPLNIHDQRFANIRPRCHIATYTRFSNDSLSHRHWRTPCLSALYDGHIGTAINSGYQPAEHSIDISCLSSFQT